MKTTLTAVTWISFPFNSTLASIWRFALFLLQQFKFRQFNKHSQLNVKWCTTLLCSDLSVGSEQVTPFWHFFISFFILHTSKIITVSTALPHRGSPLWNIYTAHRWPGITGLQIWCNVPVSSLYLLYCLMKSDSQEISCSRVGPPATFSLGLAPHLWF